MTRRCSTLVALLAALGVPHASAVTVTTLSDSGPGSLRAAIADGGDIDFAVTGAISLTGGELVINGSRVISGPGADHLTVQRSAADGTPAFRVLRVQSGAVIISGLTIRNGFASGGDHDGGGILNRSSLTLNDCIVSGNRADANGRGAGIYNAYAAALTVNRCVFANNVTTEGEGGGIYVFGEATIHDSTFRENSGAGTYSRGGGVHVDYFGTGHVARCTFSANWVAGVYSQGGGIYNYGTLDIVNSTFSGNRSGGTGGGLHVDALSRGTTIRNCTISGNSATEGAGIYNNGFQPSNTGRVTISDSIVAGNPAAAEDIDNSGIISSGGHNLFGVIAGNNILAGAGDRFGLGADALKLGPLANNGGPTQTRALLAGSPAIEAGNETVFPDTDQRGVLRPFGPRADIGAFELDQVLPTNQPPTVSIVSPVNGATFIAPASIFLLASVHDPDGIAVAATVEFFAGTNKLGKGQPFDPGPPHDAAFLSYWTNVPPGEYDLTARVTDDRGATAISAPVHIRINGADNLPVVRITATDPNAAEPDDLGTFTVFRDGPTNNTLQVHYAIGGSASNGVDYVALSNSVTVPAGLRSVQVPVAPMDDGLVEGLERVEIRLAPIIPPAAYIIGSPSSAVVSIADNEPPPTNQPPTITIVAPTNGATFTAPANIFVIASVHDPDGNAWAATVEFFAGTNKLGNGYIFDPGPLHEAIFRFSWTSVLPGEYDLTAKVTDDDGATAFSSPVHIRVQRANSLPVVTVIATDAAATEPDNSGMFTIYRSSGTNGLVVYYTLSGTASNGVDYFTPPPPSPYSANSVLIPAGVNSVSIPIAPRDDNLVEGPETVVLRLAYCPDFAPCYALGSPSNAVVTIFDNDPPTNIYQPIVTIEATDAHASEPGVLTVIDPGIFTVYRAGNTSATLYVRYRIDGTASNGVDYVAISNIVVIPAGATSARILINPLHDLWAEGTETVALRLEEPGCIAIYPPPPDCYRVGTPREAAVYIADNYPVPTNQPPTIHIVTPTNGATFIAPANIRICADARDTNGYVNTVEFFAGTNSLGIRTNCLPCANIQNPYCLTWSNVPPGNYELTAKVTDNQGASTVSAPVHISVQAGPLLPVVTLHATDPNASEPRVPGVIDAGVFTVTRSGNTNDTLLVRYSIHGTASNGVDYAATSNAIVIPAGKTSAELVIAPRVDNLIEVTETVVLRLDDILCAAIYPPPPGCYLVGIPREAVVYIADGDAPTNHPPTVHIFTPTNGASFVPPADIFIAAQAQDVDGYLTIQTVEFFAGAHSLGIRTNFPTLDPIGPFKLVWTNVPPGNYVLTAKARDSDGAFGISPPVEIRVVEPNHPPTNALPIVTITAADAIAAEGTNCWRWPGWSNSPPGSLCLTNTATLVVRRTGDTNTSLSVLYEIGGTASNGVDYAALPGSVTIPAGHRAVEIKIVPVDDALAERIETVVVALVGRPIASNTSPPYIVGQSRRAAAIIVDNDQPRPTTGMLPDRNFHLMRPGNNGTWWRIECSTNLVDWTALGTYSVTDGAIHFVDPDGDEQPQRFYRALPESNPPDE